ncbi:MAG: CsgG/HfaB family protein [Smithellaceae bacterium]|nr:CsgG/HfaB family protein [Smithellaceae bacterium]
MKKLVILLFLSLFLAGCATTIKHDPTAFLVDPMLVDPIPEVCKATYATAKLKVALANFTNNTTFEYAKMVQSSVQGTGQRTAVGGAAVGVTPAGAGVIWGAKETTQFQQDAQSTEREINAKLSESVEDGVMDELVNMGGATIFTRKDMEKIMMEHKFQASGLVDDRNLVRLGKLAGVKLLITGSVNNVDLSYKTMEAAKRGASGLGDRVGGGAGLALSLIGAVAAAGMEATEGWNISTDVSLRILDVETGEILFSKIVTGKHIIGKTPYPNYDALIGGMKKAASKALEDARPQLSKWFTVRGYVLQTRTSADRKERSALINLGEKDGLMAGAELFAYVFQAIGDPFDPKKISCDVVKLPVRLMVTDQLQADKAWVMIHGEAPMIARVKAGQLVERKPLEGQTTMKRMGF